MGTNLPTSIWIQRQQCPCGDWKCFIKYEVEQGQVSQSAKNETSSLSCSEFFFTPYVGQVFKSDGEAFEYYSRFARSNGFSIRKARSTESHNLGVYRRDFVCYCSGFNQPRKKTKVEHPRDRKSVRCGCDAKLYLTKEIVDGVSQWYISQFSNVHNHELLEDDQVRLLPAYRKIQEADQERILLLSKAGFPVNKIIKVLEFEKGVQPGQLPFIEKDIRNFVRTCKKTVHENDSLLTEKRDADMSELLEVCKAMAKKDGGFVFDFVTDANGKVGNIAWSYGDSVRAFNFFGDVILFDITYQSITYGMLLGVFSGINNHGKPIFFCYVLLQEETSHSFKWALQTFLRLMQGRQPQTIITDLESGMKDAIASELPNTKHVVSLRYIMSKLGSWFSLTLGPQYLEFKLNFEMLYYRESIEDFERQWNHFVARFGVESDKHISLLSSYRASWAFSYVRDCFVARIMTAEYFRSFDSILKGILSAHSCLSVFFEQVSLATYMGYRSKEEVQLIHRRSCIPIEDHVYSVLTPYAFNVFQHELILSMQYAIMELANGSYIVRHHKKREGEYFVICTPEDEQIHCSCKEFERSGILCRHALRFLVTKNYFIVPDKYVPFRWKWESSLAHVDQESIRTLKEQRYQTLHSLADTLLTEALICKERFNHVSQELTALLDHVKVMPAHEGVFDMATNNFHGS